MPDNESMDRPAVAAQPERAEHRDLGGSDARENTPPLKRALTALREHGGVALALTGAIASLTGLAIVAGVMGYNSAHGTDYATWSWIATGIVWPLGLVASLAALRGVRSAALAMVVIGLGSSFLFVWEYGQAGGVPLAMAGAALLGRRDTSLPDKRG